MATRKRKATAWAVAVASLGVLLLLGTTGCFLFLNEDPIAKIVVDVLSGETPLVVTFSALDSSDPDGDVVTYEWDFGDGTTASGASVQHVFVAAVHTETYTVKLTITDNDGATATATQTIEVRIADGDGAGGTDLPVARFTAAPFIGRGPLNVTFSAGGSTPGNGSIVAYNWDFGDNEQATGSSAAHTFDPDVTTTFVVTLFVWNSYDQVDTEQQEIVVIVPSNNTGDDPPVAAATVSDPNMIYESDNRPTVPSLFEVEFDPRASYSAVAHVIEYYAWDFGDGDVQVETTDIEVTHIYGLSTPARTYQASLTVYDDQGEYDVVFLNVTLEDD